VQILQVTTTLLVRVLPEVREASWVINIKEKEMQDINSTEYLKEWIEVAVERIREHEFAVSVEDKSQLGKYREVIERTLFSVVASGYAEPQFRSLGIDGRRVTLKFTGAEMPADMPNPMPITSRYQDLKQLESDIANGMAEAMAKEAVAA